MPTDIKLVYCYADPDHQRWRNHSALTSKAATLEVRAKRGKCAGGTPVLGGSRRVTGVNGTSSRGVDRTVISRILAKIPMSREFGTIEVSRKYQCRETSAPQKIAQTSTELVEVTEINKERHPVRGLGEPTKR